ncbi:DNA-binding protein [Bacillus subtilis]|uniref:DNA-binding protein n=1 Tax=Bacillus subtilis TaxID=1423 RepID=UPI0021D97804|nr:DNA-binding protein [Bacillus subtilis]
MQLTKKEALQLVKTIHPHVSGFSRGFQLNGKLKQEVVCGGKVKHIVDMSLWSNGDLVYVTIDDGVGELLVVVPKVLWDETDVTNNSLIVAEGILYAPSKDLVFKSRAGTDIKKVRKDEPFRVLVRSIKMIKEN